MANPVFIYIACKNIEEARKIAGHCTQERLAASANIFPVMETVYWWDGQLNNESETVLILKTMDEHFQAVEAAVRRLHSYECPCICALPVTQGYQPYLDWIKTETICQNK